MLLLYFQNTLHFTLNELDWTEYVKINIEIVI